MEYLPYSFKDFVKMMDPLTKKQTLWDIYKTIDFLADHLGSTALLLTYDENVRFNKDREFIFFGLELSYMSFEDYLACFLRELRKTLILDIEIFEAISVISLCLISFLDTRIQKELDLWEKIIEYICNNFKNIKDFKECRKIKSLFSYIFDHEFFNEISGGKQKLEEKLGSIKITGSQA
ncbi:hypothetical protein AB834_02115 [PVC group bacterium (ex Bugula neritina AB1)]|nr:hypothetical protein AB834_02115 [PVC group bacterium (ex Bugula neritina AB1)]